MENVPMGGAALEYLRQKFGGVFAELESAPSMAVATSSAVGNNPDRLGLLIMNLGSSSVTLGLKQPLVNGAGVIIAANGGAMSLNVDEDFTLVTREWFGNVSAGTSALYVLEIVRPISMAQLGGKS